jgi:glycosyltransferase involved in cell wall biosynthesis
MGCAPVMTEPKGDLIRPIGVCMLIPSLNPLQGGAERQLEQLCSTLCTYRDVRVFILTRQIADWNRLTLASQVDLFEIHATHSLSFALKALFFLIRHRADYDIIHTHTEYSPAIIAALAGRWLHKRVIVKIRRLPQDGLVQFRGSLRAQLRFRLLNSGVDRWMAISQAIEHELSQIVEKSKISFIPNAVDTTAIRPLEAQARQLARQKLGIPETMFVGLFVGNLRPRKRVDVLLKAWHELKLEGIQARLLILGSGDCEESLREMIYALSLEKDVIWAGLQPYQQVIHYLQMANVFVLPSESEGLSNALLEAMAAGVAVISTRVSGSLELIDDGVNGLLVDIGDVEGLAAALKHLACDPNLCTTLGHRARQTVDEKYSLVDIAKQYLQLYDDLLR